MAIVALTSSLGAAPAAVEGARDPLLPTGPALPSAWARPHDELSACSFNQPVCVHARRGDEVTLLAVLGELERAAAALHGALALPRPLPDGVLGGGPAFDLYLTGPTGLPGVGVITARDRPEPAPLDRTSAFALLRGDMPGGRLRQHLVARAYASAIGWALDAAEDPSVREGNATYLAQLVAPCEPLLAELVDDEQANPERGALTPTGEANPRPAVLFPWFLEKALGSGPPGALTIALASTGSQKTPPGALAWHNEPDLLDALRGALRSRTPPQRPADLWLDFAIARLFAGDRDDGAHWPETRGLGGFGRVRFDWSIPLASLPRRVAASSAIDPGGMAYVWIDVTGAAPGSRLALRMEWERPVPFRWALVRVRPDGSEASRVLVVDEQHATWADKNLDQLEGLSGVAVVGVNTGDLALDDPFDPDEAPYEPHGYVLTLALAP